MSSKRAAANRNDIAFIRVEVPPFYSFPLLQCHSIHLTFISTQTLIYVWCYERQELAPFPFESLQNELARAKSESSGE
jgi:hypothetical protein